MVAISSNPLSAYPHARADEPAVGAALGIVSKQSATLRIPNRAAPRLVHRRGRGSGSSGDFDQALIHSVERLALAFLVTSAKSTKLAHLCLTTNLRNVSHLTESVAT
jgi:hypothetical protein